MIPLFKVSMSDTDEFKQDIIKTLTSGFITQGSKVEIFEEHLRKRLGHDYIITTNTGTSALTLAFRMLNLDPNDEVISTPLTCVATNFAILANNLKIKWADVDPETCIIDLEDVKRKLTSKTRALCFVHWGGNVIDYNALNKVKIYAMEKFGYNLHVVEDCAHAFGAPVDIKNNICMFSLQAIKHLTTVDGGILTVPTTELYERGKLLRWYGVDRDPKNRKDFRIEEDIPEWGYKFHMNDVNATIGIHNLKLVNTNIEILRKNGKFYNEELKTLKCVQMIKYHPQAVYWLYTLKIKDRDEFVEFMKTKGVQASKVHKRNDGHTCLKDSVQTLPQLDDLEKNYVCIPVGWWLSDNDKKYIVKCIKEWDIKFQITIRNVKVDDFEGVRLLQKTLNRVDIQYDSREFAERLKLCGKIMIAEVDGKVIGMAKLVVETKLTASVGHIEDVVVLQEYRGLGISSLLIDKLKNSEEVKGCYKLVLSCKEKYIDTYLKAGFNEVNISMTMRL